MNAVHHFFLTFKYCKQPVKTLYTFYRDGGVTLQLRNGATISVEKGKGEFGCVLEILANNWRISNTDDAFQFEKDGVTLRQPGLGYLHEDFDSFYLQSDLTGRKVLDVGAYAGDTAVFFAVKGNCSHVYAYEKDKDAAAYITENAALNNVEEKITAEATGVGDCDNCVPWETVLDNAIANNVTFAKIDCEGCEAGLQNISQETLKNIPEWCIETHSPAIENSICSHFQNAGFTTEKIDDVAADIRLYRFTLPQ